jgi:hypothetical protein
VARSRRQRSDDHEAHAYRVLDADPDSGSVAKATCACGAEFDTDEEWRSHYESETTEAGQAKAEGRGLQDSGPKPLPGDES